MQKKEITVLGIESSCDDTSAAVIRNGCLLSNVMANQEVHRNYGGVIPELASRAHQQHIIPVVDRALKLAGVPPQSLDAIAFTCGPGLLGSLLVGNAFAKGLALATGAALVEVNHLQGHVLSHFISEQLTINNEQCSVLRSPFSVPHSSHPVFPFLCLLVSGGHTQIIVVRSHFDFEIIGNTIDDAAGEAFDKCAKVMGLPYPGGPVIDRLAAEGNAAAFQFAKPRVGGLNYSFSGLKTSFLYFLRDRLAGNKNFIDERRADLCASLQQTIIDILFENVVRAVAQTGITEVAVAGGVSANSGLRRRFIDESARRGWKAYLPELRFTTDNAAMIAVAGYHKFLHGHTAQLDAAPYAS
ncbi:MAG: tRNA (adenosine(37)-N6)-threonylcarbamoyltransferase complex transferase subunit TsaD [Prevotellaceae bacterium]|jgi:N6-L-threonylcarbamoyladenine synthase|nr:tRNA (adenosine(37)-N6)-threonylcarbamoyltransferase complex transferase subunit TsaD [Prevotellaceae bacterium]